MLDAVGAVVDHVMKLQGTASVLEFFATDPKGDHAMSVSSGND